MLTVSQKRSMSSKQITSRSSGSRTPIRAREVSTGGSWYPGGHEHRVKFMAAEEVRQDVVVVVEILKVDREVVRHRQAVRLVRLFPAAGAPGGGDVAGLAADQRDVARAVFQHPVDREKGLVLKIDGDVGKLRQLRITVQQHQRRAAALEFGGVLEVVAVHPGRDEGVDPLEGAVQQFGQIGQAEHGAGRFGGGARPLADPGCSTGIRCGSPRRRSR